jgi:hypothetical protein
MCEGRPNIKVYLRETSSEDVNWIQMAQDITHFEAFVSIALNHGISQPSDLTINSSRESARLVQGVQVKSNKSISLCPGLSPFM